MSIAGTCAVCALKEFGVLTQSQLKLSAADQSCWSAQVAVQRWLDAVTCIPPYPACHMLFKVCLLCRIS